MMKRIYRVQRRDSAAPARRFLCSSGPADGAQDAAGGTAVGEELDGVRGNPKEFGVARAEPVRVAGHLG